MSSTATAIEILKLFNQSIMFLAEMSEDAPMQLAAEDQVEWLFTDAGTDGGAWEPIESAHPEVREGLEMLRDQMVDILNEVGLGLALTE